jgi:hypothetical protein
VLFIHFTSDQPVQDEVNLKFKKSSSEKSTIYTDNLRLAASFSNYDET